MRNLQSIGMEKGLLYETIITTQDANRKPNAAPIGVICRGVNEVVIYLHEGSQTSRNIKANRRFIVNILKDPLRFVESTLGTPPLNHFDQYRDDFYLKDTDAFFSATVKDIKDIVKKDDLGPSKLSIITAEVDDIKIKRDQVEPLNRAIFAILEALIYLSRMEIADKDTAEIYSEKIRDMSRIVSRVGGSEHKKAMNTILEALENRDE